MGGVSLLTGITSVSVTCATCINWRLRVGSSTSDLVVAAAGYMLLLTLVMLIFLLAYVMVTTLVGLRRTRSGCRGTGTSCSGRKGEEEDENRI